MPALQGGPAGGDGPPDGHPIPASCAPRRTGQKPTKWRREAPIRPVVFEDAGVLGDDTVYLHPEQRLETELRKHEGGGVRLAIEFSEEEKRQRQADVASWRTRLVWFDRDLDTEPARIRGFCEVRARRVEPVGLVYLWLDTG